MDGAGMKTNEAMELGPLGVKAFEGRKIRPETAARLGVFTGRGISGGKVIPDRNGNIVVFPTFENDACVAEKYRAPGKKFWMRTGSKNLFWNLEAVEIAEKDRLIITEGEIDALTAIDCGFEKTVSVPNGAPAKVGDIDPSREDSGRFAYLWNARRELAAVKEFILAVDNDEPGQALAEELVRRLSAARCFFVTYPEGCKDLNDVRMEYGPEAVVRVLNEAQRYPLRGLYRLSDYPDRPPIKLCQTGWVTLDEHLKLFPGELMVVTGIPGHGKSSWTAHLIANIVDATGWRAGIFSPEMPLIPYLRDKLRGIKIGYPVANMSAAQINNADDWIEDRFVFLDADPSGAWDAEERTLDWIIDKATEAVMRDGIRILLLDPWNEIEHSARKGEMMGEYIGRAIRELRRFAQHRGVIVIIVAHPTKDIAKEKEKRAPGLYDIDGSAHWANKPDHGVAVYRAVDDGNLAEIHVGKVRFADTGKRGKVTLQYDPECQRYFLRDRSDEKVPDEGEISAT